MELLAVASPAACVEGKVNVIDHAMLRDEDLTPGKINAKSGAAARAYVVHATQAALAGEIAAAVSSQSVASVTCEVRCMPSKRMASTSA